MTHDEMTALLRFRTYNGDEEIADRLDRYRDALDSLEMHACDSPAGNWKMIPAVEWHAIFEALK